MFTPSPLQSSSEHTVLNQWGPRIHSQSRPAGWKRICPCDVVMQALSQCFRRLFNKPADQQDSLTPNYLLPIAGGRIYDPRVANLHSPRAGDALKRTPSDWQMTRRVTEEKTSSRFHWRKIRQHVFSGVFRQRRHDNWKILADLLVFIFKGTGLRDGRSYGFSFHPSRLLELVDPRHRYGKELEEQWKIWMTQIEEERSSCSDVVSSNPYWQSKIPHFFTWLTSRKVEIPSVQYLDLDQRKFYELQIINGLCYTSLNQLKTPLHTFDPVDHPHAFVLAEDLVRSETGAWVYKRAIYVGMYFRRIFHHSSMANKNYSSKFHSRILAAGEFELRNGQLSVLTDKSGHLRKPDIPFKQGTEKFIARKREYQATTENAMRLVLTHLRQMGLNIDHVAVKMDCVIVPFTGMRSKMGVEFFIPQAQGEHPKHS